MVKGYDTTVSDPTKILLDYLFGFSQRYKDRISLQKANEQIKYWLKNDSSTSKVYKQFSQQSIKPQIVLHKYCTKPYWFSSGPYDGDSYYPAYQTDNKINICINRIRNKIELKQNLDRQLHTMYSNRKLNNQQALMQVKISEQIAQDANQKIKDKHLIQSLYQGCLQGYRNYGWQQSTEKRVATKCAIYLFRRRSSSKLPPDSLFRYSSIIAQQYCI